MSFFEQPPPPLHFFFVEMTYIPSHSLLYLTVTSRADASAQTHIHNVSFLTILLTKQNPVRQKLSQERLDTKIAVLGLNTYFSW